MKKRIVLLIYLLIGLASCTEEEVIPRTNPRFSVALVQSINESGAEFSANIFDYGSEEIFEYGFVYGKNSLLSDPDTEVVSAQGRPPVEFKLKAVKGLKRGDMYTVAAFVKTTSGIVYSQSKLFRSEGSIGFIIDKIISPEEVYFGTELTFEVKNLPRNLSKVKVYFEGYQTELLNINENGFRIKIPEKFEFDQERAKDNRFIIKITSGENELEFEKVLNFKKPTFNLTPNNRFNYSEGILIEGENLRDINVVATYRNADGASFNLDVIKAEDNLIHLKTNAFFTEEKPVLVFKIRGLEYEIANSFSLNPTIISPNQEDYFDGWYKDIVIKGENFNPNHPSFNKVGITGSNYHVLKIVEASSNHLKVEVRPSRGTFDRTLSIFSQMGSGMSQNAFMLKINIPELPYLELPYGFLNDITSIGLSYQEKGYFIGSNGIFEFSGEQELPAKIFGNLPFYSYAPIKYATAGEGKIFLSDGNRLFSFDLQTKQLEQLPDIPNESSNELGIFVEGGYLYSEYGAIEEGFSRESAKKRFRFNLSTKVWQELPSHALDSIFISNKTFRFNGELYIYRIAISDNGSSVFIERFNAQTASWSLATKTDYGYLPITTNEIYVLGDKVYFPALSNSFIWEPQQNRLRRIENFWFGTWPKNGFKIKNKIYQFNRILEQSIMFQIDPVYFKFGN